MSLSGRKNETVQYWMMIKVAKRFLRDHKDLEDSLCNGTVTAAESCSIIKAVRLFPCLVGYYMCIYATVQAHIFIWFILTLIYMLLLTIIPL